jgi:hypothetical protein
LRQINESRIPVTDWNSVFLYDRWRYHYPAFDDSVIKAKIPPDIQPDVQGPKKRGRKPNKA